MATKPQKQNNQPNPGQAQAQVTQSQQWSGPLPPPAALERFSEIIPNGAERIMSMVELEQGHRIDHEKTGLRGEIRATQRMHYLGASIAVLAILSAAIGGYLGVHPVICVALVGLPIATIIQSIFSKR